MGIIKKEIKVMDTVTTPIEVLQHSVVNFLYGFLNGTVIITMILGNPWLILCTYYILKQVESKILNRNKYTSNFGKRYLFPIPSTLGFLTGWYLGTFFK